jgi:hypothetical protein
MVRFICFAILATGVLALECLRNSLSRGLVQRARFATLFAMDTLHWAVITNEFGLAHCNVEQLVPPLASFVGANGALYLAERVRHLNPKHTRLQ